MSFSFFIQCRLLLLVTIFSNVAKTWPFCYSNRVIVKSLSKLQNASLAQKKYHFTMPPSHKIAYRTLPFYPSYKTQVRGHVVVWWFDKDFSQSRYNFKCSPASSNACTLITVLLAARCHYDQVQIIPEYKYELSQEIIYMFAQCILQGNEIHDTLRKIGALENINLTIPEAIQGAALRNIVEWRTELYIDIKNTLYTNIRNHIIEWVNTELYEAHPNLYIILIADSRSVLLVYQDFSDLITLIDSHQHLKHGALLAQVPRNRLKALCYWFNCMIVEYFESYPDCYELSFLYFGD